MGKYKRKWKHFQHYMENLKASFPEYQDGDEQHDFGHQNWHDSTWVFHEIYKLSKGILL